MCPLSHGWVLHLHADQTQSKWNDPPGVINGLKVLAVSFSIAYDSTSSLCGDAEANEVEDEVGHAHVDSVAVKHELTIVRTRCRPFNESVAHVGDADPDTANEVQQEVHSLICLLQLSVKLGVWYDLIEFTLEHPEIMGICPCDCFFA